MRRFSAILIGLLVLALQPIWVSAGTVTELVVFGDSLCDVGNRFDASGGSTPAHEDYWDGRYSNGPVWVSRYSELRGLAAPTRSLADGTNYAYGGAETGSGISGDISNIGEQIRTYLDVDLRTPSDTTLVVLWGGANDIFGAGIIEANAYAAATLAVANLGQHIRTLADKGATQFLVPHLPPLGSTPIGIQYQALVPFWDPVSAEFNAALSAELDSLRSDLSVTIDEFDTHGMFLDAIANQSAYGLTNVTDRARDALGGTDVSGYLFWDDVHPTTYGHQILAESMAIPEPGPITLLLSAGLVLVLASLVKSGARSRSAAQS